MLLARPSCIPKSRRLAGTKAAGLRYESQVQKEVAAAYTNALLGPWFEYIDSRGKWYCQPDIVIPVEQDRLVVLECKLTDCELANKQLAKLYLPVLAMTYNKRALGVKVVKHLTRRSNISLVIETLGEAIERASANYEEFPIWHFI